MLEYKAPLRDIEFLMNDLLDYKSHYEALGFEDADPDTVQAILGEAAKFAEEVVGPLNQSGDQEGCKWEDGVVTTPKGFKEAYKQYCEAGWPSLPGAPELGGQGLPASLTMIITEMVGSANWSWSMYPGLSNAATRLLNATGSDEQKELYLKKLISGEWTGTMCLTESHAGSDLGLLRTKATENADGSYNITGTKIFISCGEHDMADNIVHLVLARIEGAPEGTSGISLFVAPKFLLDENGNPGERNSLECGSIEHKMGIKASATCVMNFDSAKGWLVGKPNEGLKGMFHMMNAARVGTATQGVAMAEQGYQGALAYAKDRLQMRSLTGPKNENGPADPIIVHPDVRRMLLTQKAISEGNRAFMYWVNQLVDQEVYGNEDVSKEANAMLDFLTPIAKAFATETGLEAANHGVQMYGGHGFIGEWGMEQVVRDGRIATLYEGTTGIQALDLLGRKVMGSGGALLANFTKVVHKYCKANEGVAEMAEFIEPLAKLNTELGELTGKIGEKAMQNADEVGAASVDYLMYSGYVVLAFMWARMAEVALKNPEDGFMKSKIKTAQFYYARLLPRTVAHRDAMLSGSDNLMSLDEELFAF